MEKELPRKIKEHLQIDETLLWYGKPDKKIISRDEKVYLVEGIIRIAISFIMINIIVSMSFLNLMIFIVSALLIYIIIRIIYWITTKQNTFFLITNERVLRIDMSANEVIQNNLSDLKYFEARYMKKGGNLYLGKYRFRAEGFRFDYTKGYVDRFNDDEGLNRSILIWKQYKTADYLFFYSLADVDTPAQIIRERTNAKEYIDPKRAKKTT